ncbi:allatostatin-A receptor-like [Diadema antillarum]|uniref:allatostatin-A receptor-like n=1 Tax=Diadema antillarum TaxID=105358 RepID=UPI003A85D668
MSFMQDENAAMTSDDITPIPAAWILAFISGVSLFCNALNLLIIPTLKELADATKVFYASLAIIDLVFTLLIIVMVKPSLTGEWEYGRLMCKVSGFLIGITSGSSATVVALLNVDRFAFIIKPLHYSRIVTTRRCVIAVAVMILLLVFVGVVEHVFAGDLFDIVRFREFGICLTDNRHRRFLPFTIFNFVIGYWSPALVILCLYVVILRTVWRHSKVIATQERIVDQLMANVVECLLFTPQERYLLSRNVAKKFGYCDPNIVDILSRSRLPYQSQDRSSSLGCRSRYPRQYSRLLVAR